MFLILIDLVFVHIEVNGFVFLAHTLRAIFVNFTDI